MQGIRIINSNKTSIKEQSASKPYLAAVAAVTWVGFLACFVLIVGPARIMAPTDVFSLLDGGWRIFSGQTQHVDYYSPLGSLTYVLVTAGMKLGAMSLKAHVLGNLLFCIALAAWAAPLLMRRLTPSLTLLSLVALTLLVVAPRPLGYDVANTTYAMVYNRYGWALLLILAVQTLFPTRAGVPPRDRARALSTGALLGLLFYCKISFFAVGVGCVALAAILEPRVRTTLHFMLLGMAAVAFGFFAIAGIDPVNYIADIAMAGRAQSPDMRIVSVMRSIETNLIPLVLLAALWVATCGREFVTGRFDWTLIFSDAARTTLKFGLLVGGAMTLTMMNASEGRDVPLLPLAALILVVRRRGSSTRRTKLTHVAAACLALLLAGNIVLKDAASLGVAANSRDYRISRGPVSQHFNTPRLADFVIPHFTKHRTAYWYANLLPEHFNDGIGLIMEHAPEDWRLAVMGYTDYFSFALGQPPARGMPLWWDLNYTFSRSSHPSAEVVLGEANLLMTPVAQADDAGCCWETVAALQEIYGADIRSRFIEAGRSNRWILYRLRE